jgi:hypothetical protein
MMNIQPPKKHSTLEFIVSQAAWGATAGFVIGLLGAWLLIGITVGLGTLHAITICASLTAAGGIISTLFALPALLDDRRDVSIDDELGEVDVDSSRRHLKDKLSILEKLHQNDNEI